MLVSSHTVVCTSVFSTLFVESTLSAQTKVSLDLPRNSILPNLKFKEKCDAVICLSHLGFKYNGKKVSDETLATKTQNIDLILGGHTHTFLAEPVNYKNLINKNVMVNQVGWAGLRLGAVRINFESLSHNNLALHWQGESAINIQNV